MADDKPEYGEKFGPEDTMMKLVDLIPNEGDSITIGNTVFTNHGELPIEADWAPVEKTVLDDEEDI